MNAPEPKVPDSLDPIAIDVLGRLHDDPAAAALVLGGGVALKHYADFRPTYDIDAWWASGPDADALAAIQRAMEAVAAERGLTFEKRGFGDVASYELRDPAQRPPRVFSFQVAARDIQLEDPVPSAWPPLRLETLADNIGAKMNALVGRGAPRDFVDIYEVVHRNIISATECWDLWQRKNPDLSVTDAKAVVLRNLSALELRQPLASLPAEAQDLAADRRAYFRDVFVEPRLRHRGYTL